ncbi:sigma-54-dependent transcriptional regulator [Fodinicurvata fenggangensis]|uniref:sigma-54-dependent transcriptional regulator n=1 Tax=Fodinicurvata fenggangensis TaxID=1121830 RepID=UPI0004799B6F|nr:sigma-54 dependent transcriptional regulator [Fodinicurvata fenggangensis]
MSLENRRIAVVEDDPIMGESLLQRLSLEGGEVTWWRDGNQALEGFRQTRPEVVVCDIRLPDLSGEELFRRTAEHASLPFLFITAYGDIDQAVRLMRAGAGDYLTKPFEMEALLVRLDDLLRPAEPARGGSLGASPQMCEIENLLRRLADRPSPVLLTGETGVGKEICARFLHQASRNAGEPFIAVNCAAIPSELLESELFGHEKGAFTGASARHLGYAERAGSGTLFLDEIGELPFALQGKLLRLLEDRSFPRVGGEKPIAFKARVVTATTRDLAADVRDGLFRDDLYYRINVVSVDIPPLRQRSADITLLMENFFEAFMQDGECSLRGISSLAEEAALAHDWPGNVRELRNRIDRAVALAPGPHIMPCDLFPEQESLGHETAGDTPASLAKVREAAERREILRALEETGGQLSATARRLGVSRTTLWEKMRRFGIGNSLSQ